MNGCSTIRLARAGKNVDVVIGGLANRICHLANLMRRGKRRVVLWTKMECPVEFAELFNNDFGLNIVETDETFEERTSVLTCAPQQSLFCNTTDANQVLKKVIGALNVEGREDPYQVAVHGRFLCHRMSQGAVSSFASAINAFLRERSIREVFLLSDAHREALKGLIEAEVVEARCGEMQHDGDRSREEVLRFASDLRDLCQSQFVLSNNGASSMLHLSGAWGAANFVFGPVKEMRASMLDVRGIKPLFIPRSEEPRREDLAVVTCHYNFGEFDTSRRNLCRFVRQMQRDGVNVYGVEAYLSGQRPLTSHLSGWKQIELTKRQILWHKESLLNIAERELVPTNIPNIVFMDADVWFDTPRWPDKVVAALSERPIVQPFETAVWSGRNGHEVRHKPSVAVAGVQQWLGHSGFAWAMRREVIREIGGLFDLGILGGGDHMLAFACLHEQPVEEMLPLEIMSAITLEADGNVKGAYLCWAAKVYARTRGQVGWISANLYHEWHGDLIHRQYHSRGNVLSGLRLERDLNRLSNGTWAWTEACDPERVKAVNDYFKSRSENG